MAYNWDSLVLTRHYPTHPCPGGTTPQTCIAFKFRLKMPSFLREGKATMMLYNTRLSVPVELDAIKRARGA